jgi:hypothetical protein
MSDDVHPLLRKNASDHAHDLMLALSSAVDVAMPGWGSAFGYLVGEVIPNRRPDRVVRFLTRLAKKLERLDQRCSMLEHLSAEKAALFEDGGREAARSTSDERINRVAEIVASGMLGDDLETTMRRDLLALFASLSDGEIATLAAYAGIRPDMPEVPQDVQLDRKTAMNALARMRSVSDFHRVRLISLGLLEQKQVLVPDKYRLGTRAREANPQKLVTERPNLTAVGRALLVELGLLQPLGQY